MRGGSDGTRPRPRLKTAPIHPTIRDMAASPQAPVRTSLGRRLFLSLLTMLVPLALLAGVAIWSHWGSTSEQAAIEREAVQEFAAVATARDAAKRLRASGRDAADTQARNDLVAALADVERLVDDPE